MWISQRVTAHYFAQTVVPAFITFLWKRKSHTAFCLGSKQSDFMCACIWGFFFCCAMLFCCLQLVFVVCFFFVLCFIIEYSYASFSFFRRLKSEFYAVASSSIFLRLYPALFILCYFLEFFNVSFCFHITCGFCLCPLRSGFFFLYYCCCYSLHLRSVCDYMGRESLLKRKHVFMFVSLYVLALSLNYSNLIFCLHTNFWHKI